VVDLHASLRSVLVSWLIRSPLKLRVQKHTLGRRLMVLSRGRYRRTYDVLGSSLGLLEPFGVRTRVLPHLIPRRRRLPASRQSWGTTAPCLVLPPAPGMHRSAGSPPDSPRLRTRPCGSVTVQYSSEAATTFPWSERLHLQ
jgi:hypothetical protein